jgi:hypothetical protein
VGEQAGCENDVQKRCSEAQHSIQLRRQQSRKQTTEDIHRPESAETPEIKNLTSPELHLEASKKKTTEGCSTLISALPNWLQTPLTMFAHISLEAKLETYQVRGSLIVLASPVCGGGVLSIIF